MKNYRHIHSRTPRYMLILLVLSFILTGLSWVQSHRLRGTATEAVRAAENNLMVASQYKELAERLVDENNDLLEALSSYNPLVYASDPTPPRYFNVAMPEELQSYIWSLCRDYGIEDYYELVYALIQHESNFDAAAISRSKDYGLMQINVCNHEYLQNELGIVDFLDPYQNVHGGIYLLAQLLHKYDVPDALMAYNMGENGASKLWQRGIHETSYTNQVLAYYSQFTGNI